MVRCSIMGCKSDSERKITGLSFHSFPEDPNLRNIWTDATRRSNWIPKPGSKICSEHFNRTLLWKKGKKTYLNPVAVPKKLSDSVSPADEPACSSSSVLPIKVEYSETLIEPSSNTVWLSDSVNPVDEPACSSSSVLPIKVEYSETLIEPSSNTVWLSDSVSPVDEPACSSSSVLPIKVEYSETLIEPSSNTVCLVKLECPRRNSTISEEFVTIKECENSINVLDKSKVVEASSSPDYSPRTLKRKWKNEQKVSKERLKKLKALREKSRRLTKKVAHLEQIISELNQNC